MNVYEATIKERFDERYIPEPNSGCWLWMGNYDHRGYGRIHVRRGVMEAAQRIAYKLYVGAIPPRFVVDHLCRNHACVNPKHLEAVTIGENVLRGIGRTAANARKSACHLGHDYAVVGTYITPEGKRNCMECRRMADRRRYANQTR